MYIDEFTKHRLHKLRIQKKDDEYHELVTQLYMKDIEDEDIDVTPIPYDPNIPY